jgi:SNF2 family DNA or RNA helicase
MGGSQGSECYTARFAVDLDGECLKFMFLSVMIVSYETLRTLTALLANCNIGLLLCDEGHRLKNSGKH